MVCQTGQQQQQQLCVISLAEQEPASAGDEQQQLRFLLRTEELQLQKCYSTATAQLAELAVVLSLCWCLSSTHLWDEGLALTSVQQLAWMCRPKLVEFRHNPGLLWEYAEAAAVELLCLLGVCRRQGGAWMLYPPSLTEGWHPSPAGTA